MEKTKKPNILFLLIDSFRSDKCHGNNKTSITPNLDSLIKESAYFSQTVSSAPVTIASVSSILTSQFPFKSVISDGNRFKLNSSIPNAISHLKDSDYYTVSITPKILSLSGLTNDFDREINYPRHDGLYDGVGEIILETFKEIKSKDSWFFYIHLLDVHGTSRGFPENFNDEKYGMNQYEKMVSAMDIWFGKIFDKIDFDNTLIVLTADHGNDAGIYTPEMELDKKITSKNYEKNSYNIEKRLFSIMPKILSPVKSKIKKNISDKKNKDKSKEKNEKLVQIMNQINQQNLDPYKKRILERIVYPTYDVYDDRYLVPLLFGGYGIKSGSIINHQVRTIDIFPTIFEIIKISNDEKVDGKNLLPLINGFSLDELPAYLENFSNWVKPKNKTIPQIGIRYNNFKYFRPRDDAKKQVCLFDLKNDPFEKNNIAKENPEKVTEMEKILSNIRANIHKEFKTQSDDLRNIEEEKMVEDELKKLGYL